MISGVNGWREVHVHQLLSKYAWDPHQYFQVVYDKKSTPIPTPDARQDRISVMQEERRNPSRIVWLFQHYAGDTLSIHIRTVEQTLGFRAAQVEFQRILAALRSCIADLKRERVVHGDLHPNNVCVHTDGRVFLIDFGWCLSDKFDMTADEQRYYQQCLTEGFDYQHFIDSLQCFGMDRYLIDDLLV
jgi:serine/threonine protein kinase